MSRTVLIFLIFLLVGHYSWSQQEVSPGKDLEPGRLYVVVGVFSYERNAQNFNNLVSETLGSSTIAFHPVKKWHYVFTGPVFEDLKKATNLFDKVRVEPGFDSTWVYKVEPFVLEESTTPVATSETKTESSSISVAKFVNASNKEIDFDNSGAPILFDKSGNQVAFDNRGNLVLYDVDGQKVSYENNRKPVVYFKDGNPITYDSNGSVILYDEKGNPLTIDEKGVIVAYDKDGNSIEYDMNGNPIVFTAEGDAISYYKPSDRPNYDNNAPQLFDRSGNKIELDDDKNPILFTASGKNVEYDEKGMPTSRDKNGVPLVFDKEGNRILYDGKENPILFDENGKPIRYDKDWNSVKYDTQGNPILFNKSGTQLTYDDGGSPIVYNKEGEPIIYDQSGEVVAFDDDGNLVSYNKSGKKILFDEYGNAVFYNKQGEAVSYDIDGNPIVYDKEGNPIIYAINPAGELMLIDAAMEVKDPIPVTREDLGNDIALGKKYYFNTFQSGTFREVEGKIEIVDPARVKTLGVREVHELVYIDLDNATGDLQVICDIFGYKKMQHDFNVDEPLNERTEGFIEIKGDTTMVDFELKRYTKGDLVSMFNIFYFNNSAIMKEESKYQLERLMDLLEDNDNYKIGIYGNTNGKAAGPIISLPEDSNDFFNLDAGNEGFGSAKKLSKERAMTIKRYLTDQGISEDRLIVKGNGGKKPLYDKFDTRAYRNLRVDVEILEDQ